MNANTAADALLIAAAVVWILWKQVKAAPIKSRLLVLAPLVLGYFGLRNTPGSTWTDTADLAFIVIGGLISIGLGLARGTTIRVWRGDDGTWWRQGSKMTLILWGALLVVRAAVAGTAQATHHSAASGLGPVLFSLALSFAGQNAVTALRMNDGSVGAFKAGGTGYPGGNGHTGGNAAAGYTGDNFASGNAPRDNTPRDNTPWSQPTGAPYDPAGAQGQGYGPNYGSANTSQGYTDSSIHERREQRRADRRARRNSRRGY